MLQRKIDKSLSTFLQYGISIDLAERAVAAGLNLTKLRALRIKEIAEKGFRDNESSELKRAVTRSPIQDDVLFSLLENSNFVCAACKGSKGLSYVIHHIEPYAASQNNDYENLIVLCPVDHDLAHRSFGQLTLYLGPDELRATKAKWEEQVRTTNAVQALRDRYSTDEPPKSGCEYGAIPPAPPHFLGREHELGGLLGDLLAPKSSAILVRGGPGIGKTSLTRAAGNHKDIVERFGARRWFVELETVSTAAGLEDAIARAIGLDPAKGFKATLSALHQRPGLIVLDSLETPWEPINERSNTENRIADLAAIPSIAVISSFRGGRQAFRALNWTAVHQIDRLCSPFDRELFCRTANVRFDEDPNLKDFLNVLDGIPLAIELVALRAHGRSSLGALWNEWKRVGSELASDPDYTSNPDRLTSLPHSIELSLRSSRVTDTALRLFRYLGQLPAGIVSEDRDLLLSDSADSFGAEDELVRAGLAIERTGRLDLLSPIREHAVRRHAPELADRETWPTHYLALTQSIGKLIGTTVGASAMARLLPEVANIEAAFRVRLDNRNLDEVAKALQGFAGLSSVGSLQSPILGELATAFGKAGDLVGQARCIASIGNVAFARENYVTARASYEQALTLYSKAGDVKGEAMCISGIADISFRLSDYDGASRGYGEALPLYRKVSDLDGEADCVLGLGRISLRRTDLSGASKAFTDAMSLYGKAGSVLGEAECNFDIGHIAFRSGDYSGAREAYEQALSLYRKSGGIHGEANCISGIGDIASVRGDKDSARKAYEEALPLYNKVGSVLGEANSIWRLANIALARGDYGAARNGYNEAVWRQRKAGSALGEANCISGLGDIANEEGDDERARNAYEEALPLYRKASDAIGEGHCIFLLGDIALRRGDRGQARKAYEEAMLLFRRAGSVQGEERCKVSIEKLQSKRPWWRRIGLGSWASD